MNQPTKSWVKFHAYVLGSIIGVNWGKITPASGMGNDEIFNIAKEYMNWAVGGNEWVKLRILDEMRDKKASAIKDEARRTFPSLFPYREKAKPLAIPEELAEQDVVFDLDKIKEWQKRVRTIKQEVLMDEDVADTAEQNVETSQEVVGNQELPIVNFYVPTGVDVDDLTLDNYRQLTGKRYRMHATQKARGLTREQAFQESQNLARSSQ